MAKLLSEKCSVKWLIEIFKTDSHDRTHNIGINELQTTNCLRVLTDMFVKVHVTV